MTDQTEGIVSTDEEILDNIGEGDESTTGESIAPETLGETAPTSEETSTTDDQQSTTPVDATKRPPQAGGPQDLKDRDGTVIATGGKERRFYETAQREKVRADTLDREVVDLRSQIDAVNNAGTLSTQYDLTPEEVTTGAQIIASYKKDALGTIQYMLTQAQASGHNVDEIISGNGMDAGALKQMIDSALQPLVAEQNERVDTQHRNDQALEIYNNFVGTYPDATIHENSLARLLQEQPSLTPEAAYYKLQTYYLSKGLDWTKSLEQLSTETTPSVNTQQTLPDGNVTDASVTNSTQVANVNTSFDDIIRESMKEAGIKN
jgi:hypothetical protein